MELSISRIELDENGALLDVVVQDAKGNFYFCNNVKMEETSYGSVINSECVEMKLLITSN